MNKEKSRAYSSPYEFEGRIPLKHAIPLGIQHVLAMFVGNLTPLIIICGACGIAADIEDDVIGIIVECGIDFRRQRRYLNARGDVRGHQKTYSCLFYLLHSFVELFATIASR